jgi:hypothetical protein
VLREHRRESECLKPGQEVPDQGGPGDPPETDPAPVDERAQVSETPGEDRRERVRAGFLARMPRVRWRRLAVVVLAAGLALAIATAVSSRGAGSRRPSPVTAVQTARASIAEAVTAPQSPTLHPSRVVAWKPMPAKVAKRGSTTPPVRRKAAASNVRRQRPPSHTETSAATDSQPVGGGSAGPVGSTPPPAPSSTPAPATSTPIRPPATASQPPDSGSGSTDSRSQLAGPDTGGTPGSGGSRGSGSQPGGGSGYGSHPAVGSGSSGGGTGTLAGGG